MAIKVLNYKRAQVQHNPVGGASVMVDAGVASANFACDCGKVWQAVASKDRMNENFFFHSMSSISARCPVCAAQESFDLEELFKV